MENIQFLVDAAVLNELGEKLIGRPAIALGELVKNSFDADASICRIEFGKDEIIIADDGHGMSEHDFRNIWMRIGTTHKVDEGVSKLLKRPLTGSKGIGRLSAQFLAHEMILESTSAEDTGQSLYAIVDWRNAVRGINLNEVNVGWEMRSDIITYPSGSKSGTRITLRTLKSDWDAERIKDLGNEVWMLRSPFKRPPSTSENNLKAATKKKKRRAEDFDIEIESSEIEDAMAAFDETWRNVFSNWKARIRGKLNNGRSKGTATVTVDFRPGYPDDSEDAKHFQQTVRLPIERKRGESPSNEVDEIQDPQNSKKPLVDETTFEILIFKPQGRQPGGISVGDLRDYLGKFGNVSVYDAGFRLPYYGSKRDKVGEDWLSIAADQGRRLSVSELLPERLRTQNKYMQDLPAPGRIFGAVEINTNHEREVARKRKAAPDAWLQIQPGRDRLKDNEAFYQLRDLVRFSLDFYANRYRLLDLESTERRRAKEPPSKQYDRVIKVLEGNKHDIPKPVFLEVKREVAEARKASFAEEKAADSRAALLAPLASAGMAALALNHELSRESSFLNRIAGQLRRIASKYKIDELKELANEFDEAKNRLDSLRKLFSPLLSDVDKAATDRLRVSAVVDQSIQGMRALMPGVKFEKSRIPADLRFPLGSLAEWNAILQNVLANAWNALLDSDRAEVAFRGGRDKSGREWLHVSDSGQGLDIPLDEAPKLFEAFQRRIRISDDKRSIAIGGQGLGLTIVRMIAHRRKANVAFIEPEEGYSTTFEMTWRGARK